MENSGVSQDETDAQYVPANLFTAPHNFLTLQ